MISIDLESEVEKLLEVKTTIQHTNLPDAQFIYNVLSLQSSLKPFMPIRDVALYDTAIYLTEKLMILSGGYGINTCFFEPDERRLSLADIDLVSPYRDVDELIMKANDEILRNNGAILLRLGTKEVVVGLIELNTTKMRWLKNRGIENVYSYKRTILIPPIGNYALRGMLLQTFLAKRKFVEERSWPNFVRNARRLGVNKFRVEEIEIDITVMDAEYVRRTIRPAFEIVGGAKYVKRQYTVKIIEPVQATVLLRRALEYFYRNKQTHNTVKTLIDLRLAKIVGMEKEISKIAREIALDKNFSLEYESGKENWRFALLRLKYPKLIDLVKKWF